MLSCFRNKLCFIEVTAIPLKLQFIKALKFVKNQGLHPNGRSLFPQVKGKFHEIYLIFTVLFIHIIFK